MVENASEQVEIYEFDPKKFEEQNDVYSRYDRSIYMKLLLWSVEYSGRIPRHWGETDSGMPWHEILEEITHTDKLTSDQMEAAITYPIWHVPRELGEKFLLDDYQLILMAVCSPSALDSVAKVQERLGASPAALAFATSIAHRRLTELALSVEPKPVKIRAMEATNTPEVIREEDIRIDAPEANGTAIVIQRHGKYIRDKENERAGSITEEAYEEAKSQSASVIRDMLSSLAPEEKGTVDFLLVASDSSFAGKGQRGMETGSAVQEGIKQVLEEEGISGNYLINSSPKIKGNSGPRPTPQLREPNMFTEATEFEQFLLENNPDDFWVAFEDDRYADKRREMGAEGPKELGDRLNSSLNFLSRFAKRYHRNNPGRRLVIWADSHYDTISPYIKQYVIPEREGYLPIDYGGGIGINISTDGGATTQIAGNTYNVPLSIQ
jgi:hypothetical protein